MKTEVDLLENKELRGENLNRIDILEQVKQIITLGNSKVLNTKLVAEYYEVPEKTIKTVLLRNREELEYNGVVTLEGESLKEFKTELHDGALLWRAKSVTVYSTRALLNVGMLLRDSIIAKEVRTQILNGFEKLTETQRVSVINEEKDLVFNIYSATDEVSRMIAISEFNNFKNRHIAELNAKIAEQEPKVSYHDLILQSPSTITVTQIADDYGMSAIKFNQILKDLGMQYKQSNQWHLYKEYKDKGYTQSVTHVYGKEGESNLSTKWTQSGRSFLYKLLKENNILPMIEKGLVFGESK